MKFAKIALIWPRGSLSVGVLKSDGTDGTWDKLRGLKSELSRQARRATLVKRDFGLKIPQGMPRQAPGSHLVRRAPRHSREGAQPAPVSRHSQWVLWLDVDV